VAYYEHLPELRNLPDMRREFQVELARLRGGTMDGGEGGI